MRVGVVRPNRADHPDPLRRRRASVSLGARSEARLGDEHPPRVAPGSSGRREERRSQRPAAARAEQRDGEQHRDGTSKRRPADGGGERHRDGANVQRRAGCAHEEEEGAPYDMRVPRLIALTVSTCHPSHFISSSIPNRKLGRTYPSQPNTRWVQPNPKNRVGSNPSHLVSEPNTP